MKRNVVIDAGFWIGLVDDRDQYHKMAVELGEKLSFQKLFCPWPITYEILRTKNIKRSSYLHRLRKAFEFYKVTLVDDAPFRQDCLSKVLRQDLRQRRLSLVDMVLRAILEKEHRQIGYLVTFNPKDFIDICSRRQVRMLPEHFPSAGRH